MGGSRVNRHLNHFSRFVKICVCILGGLLTNVNNSNIGLFIKRKQDSAQVDKFPILSEYMIMIRAVLT